MDLDILLYLIVYMLLLHDYTILYIEIDLNLKFVLVSESVGDMNQLCFEGCKCDGM